MTRDEFKVGQIVKYAMGKHITICEITRVNSGHIAAAKLWTNGVSVALNWEVQDYGGYVLASEEEILLYRMGG